MTEPKPEPQRDNAVTIAQVEEKTGANGPFYRIKAADGTWYSTFEHPLSPAPAAGQVWACNIKQKGKWTNLNDMLYTGKTEAAPQQAPQQPAAQPAAQQPGVTHQNVVNVRGTDRETSIIRQSCLKAAASCTHLDMTDAEQSIKTVLGVAERFFEWVTR